MGRHTKTKQEDSRVSCAMFACNIVTGLLSSHKMFAQKQLVGLMFMCVCLSLITHAYPCGTNPLQVVQKIADAKGVTYKQLLSNLEFRRQVNYLYKKYARCVGIVETGTYKRSMEPQLLQSSESSMMDPSNFQDHGDIYRRSDSFYKRASLLKRPQDTNNPGQPFYFYK